MSSDMPSETIPCVKCGRQMARYSGDVRLEIDHRSTHIRACGACCWAWDEHVRTSTEEGEALVRCAARDSALHSCMALQGQSQVEWVMRQCEDVAKMRAEAVSRLRAHLVLWMAS